MSGPELPGATFESITRQPELVKGPAVDDLIYACRASLVAERWRPALSLATVFSDRYFPPDQDLNRDPWQARWYSITDPGQPRIVIKQFRDGTSQVVSPFIFVNVNFREKEPLRFLNERGIETSRAVYHDMAFDLDLEESSMLPVGVSLPVLQKFAPTNEARIDRLLRAIRHGGPRPIGVEY